VTPRSNKATSPSISQPLLQTEGVRAKARFGQHRRSSTYKQRCIILYIYTIFLSKLYYIQPLPSIHLYIANPRLSIPTHATSRCSQAKHRHKESIRRAYRVIPRYYQIHLKSFQDSTAHDTPTRLGPLRCFLLERALKQLDRAGSACHLQLTKTRGRRYLSPSFIP